MVRTKDAIWDQTTPVTKSVTRAGMEVTQTGWRCNHCDKDFWANSKTRALMHLSGDALLCDGVDVCKKVPEDVSAAAKAQLIVDATKKTLGGKRSAEDAAVAARSDVERAGQMQTRLRGSTVETCEVNGALSDFFDGCGIAHEKVDHPLFKQLLKKVQHAPPDWKAPCAETLRSSILDVQHQICVDERSVALNHPGVKKFGMTAMTDGATIQKTPLLNFVIACVVWSQAFFLSCLDCTDHLAQGGSKDAEYVATAMTGELRRLPLPRFLDLIITDGAGDMGKFRILIVGILPWLYTIWCVSHIINCVLKRATKNNVQINDCIDKGKKIVDRFGGSAHFEHSLFTVKSALYFKNINAVTGLVLIRYCETRFGLYFLMLHRLLTLKPVLQSVVTCDEYLQKQFEDDEEKEIIMDPMFWAEVEEIVTLVWPLMMLLRLGDTRKFPTLHLVYKAAHCVEARLTDFTTGDPGDRPDVSSFAGDLLESFLFYKAELCSPIAAAASLVDTASWATGTLVDVTRCKHHMLDYIDNFAMQHFKSDDWKRLCKEQLLFYLNKEGNLSKPAVVNDAQTLSPYRFFDTHDAYLPEFCEVALHLASKICGTGEVERNWKDVKFIYTKARNRLALEKVQKLTFRYNALSSRTRTLAPGEVRAAEESAKYGIPVELRDPRKVALAPVDAMDAANSEIRAHAFKAYADDDESTWISEPEAPGTTGRYRLLDKFRGMALLEEDEETPEHRRIVDLEWLKKKPHGYKGARNSWKQWLAVSELDPAYHQPLIDEQGVEAGRFSYYIDEDLYAMILAAPRSDQPRPIALAPALSGDDDDDNDAGGEEEDDDDDSEEEEDDGDDSD